MNKIKVRAMESFKIYMLEDEIGEVFENKVYEATLHEESEEYFVRDHNNREVLVGELDFKGDLKLLEEFKRVECPICGNEGFIKNQKYCVNPDKHHGIRKEFLLLEVESNE